MLLVAKEGLMDAYKRSTPFLSTPSSEPNGQMRALTGMVELSFSEMMICVNNQSLQWREELLFSVY
jgi:hypothetical protein